MRKLFILLLFPLSSFSQNADSLIKTVNTSIADTSKIRNLISAMNLVLYTDINKAEIVYKLADSVSQKIKQPDYNFYRGNAIALHALYNYGKGNFDEAIVLLIESLKLLEQTGDKFIQGKIYNTIASAYKQRQKPEETLVYYNKALILFKEVKNDKWIANAYYNIGLVLKDLKKNEEAEKNISFAYDYFKKINDTRSIVLALNELANIRLDQNKNADALNYFNEASTKIDKVSDPLLYATILCGKGEALCQLDKANEAEPLLKESYVLFQQQQSAFQKDALKWLSVVYEKKGDFQNAYNYHKKFVAISDSLFNADKDQRMVEALQKYESELKEQQIKNKDLQIAKDKNEKTFYIIGLALLTALISLLIYFFIQKQKTNKELNEKNKIISKALNEKEILLKEIHHRVKNNLQVISSLLNLQTRSINDEKALEALKESRDRVKSMALIHQNLYRDDDLTNVDLKDYIDKLAQSLFTSYNVSKERVSLDTDIDVIKLEVDFVIPLGLIMNELISNALKYAFDGKDEGGKLQISLKKKDADIILEVKDNGKGFPQEWTMDNTNSLGLQLVKSFTQKLKASFTIENNNGTTAKMIIPNIA